MTLLFIDGCQHYTDTLDKYEYRGSSPSMNAGKSRWGDQALDCGGGETVGKNVTLGDTFVVGAAIYPFGTTNDWIIALFDNLANDYQCALYRDSSGHLYLRRDINGAILADTTSGAPPMAAINQWYYIELKATVNNATGLMTLKINGTQVLTVSGVDTQNTANASADQIRLLGPAYFCDIYILDDNGAVNNDFLGDCRVESLYPSGAGNYSQWTPSAGSNYENVDDATPDDDATYNLAGSTLLDSYAMDNLVTTSGDVYGVQQLSHVRKDDAGSVTLRNFLRQGGTDYPESGVSIGDSYAYMVDLNEEDPDTASQWDIAGVNSVEAGIERTA